MLRLAVLRLLGALGSLDRAIFAVLQVCSAPPPSLSLSFPQTATPTLPVTPPALAVVCAAD